MLEATQQKFLMLNKEKIIKEMEKEKQLEAIPPIRRGANSYKPEDVLRWGVQRFIKEVSPKEPLEIPDLGFSDEENKRMDDLLKEEAVEKEIDKVV